MRKRHIELFSKNFFLICVPESSGRRHQADMECQYHYIGHHQSTDWALTEAWTFRPSLISELMSEL
jgi:hypothetical protein